MLKRILFFLLLLLASAGAFTQSIADIQSPKLIPPSPDAAALGKYGQIPVDKSTGIPEISIPLYEIKTRRFTLPISLSYHASGIKVDEIASWVGLGWSLNAGGVITRSIMGLPDDWGSGFLYQTVPSAANLQFKRDSLYLLTTLQGKSQGGQDTEPDNFFYNFAGKAGAFVFGVDKKPVLAPYDALKVEFDTVSGFLMTDDAGNQYLFNTTEKVQATNTGMVAAAISSWYLTRMVSADKSDTIQFLYKADSLVQNDFSLSFTQNLGPQYIPNVPTDPGSVTLWPLAESTNERSYFPIRISSILFKGGRVDFVQKTGRLDKANVSLDSIVISSFNPSTQSYQRLKSVKLATNYLYSTLSNPTTPAYLGSDEPSKYRLILTDVLQNDQNNAPTAVYHLDYNPTMLPPLHNFGQDQWGFYNGQYANPSLLQSQQVAAGGVVFTIGGPYGADRSVNPTAMQAGMLQKITYPTKGFTEFNYESNFQNVPSSVQTSLDAASVGFYQDTSITYYTPTVSNLETGGSIFHVLIPHYGGIPDTLTIPFNPFVQITDLTTGNIFYSKQGNATTDVDETHTLDLVVGHHYQLMAVSVIHGATLQTNTNYLPKASILTSFVVQVGSATPVGGLRIASIRQYDSDSSLLGTETYEYPGEGTLLSASFMTNKITHTAWYLNSNTSAPLTTYCNASVYSLSSLSGSPVGYPNVTVYHGDATQNTGKSTFAYNIFADSVVFCPPAYFNGVMPVPITWKNGNPVHEAQYKRIGNGVYALEQEKYTSYNYFFKPNGRGLKIGATIEALGFDPFSFPYWTALDLYWFDYPISSGIRVPAQTIVNQYDSGGVTVVMTDTTNFYYDDTTLYMPTRKVTRDSRGRTMLTVTYRPLEKSAINALTALASDAGQAIDSMVARHILSPIIEEGHFIDGNLTQLSLSNYKLWNPQLIAPQNIQVQLGGGPLDTRILFNQYDASGNLLEVQKANDLKETYLWGYQGLYPVAKIQNTTYATASPYIAQSAMDHPTSDAALQTQLNSLRTIPGTLVNTFTYRPLVGMTSQIDPSGKTTYYEYDSFQRLKDTRDNQGNIIKTWDYHYKGQ